MATKKELQREIVSLLHPVTEADLPRTREVLARRPTAGWGFPNERIVADLVKYFDDPTKRKRIESAAERGHFALYDTAMYQQAPDDANRAWFVELERAIAADYLALPEVKKSKTLPGQ